MGSPEKLDRRYLEALSGGKALSADDWWWIIETLKTRMKPLLKSISLPRLGDLRCLRDFEKSHPDIQPLLSKYLTNAASTNQAPATAGEAK